MSRRRVGLQSGGVYADTQTMGKPTTTISLSGQLLFAEQGEGTVTIDCLLTRAGTDGPSLPVTLEARFPGRARARAALEVLDEWASRVATVEVVIHETAKGPSVEIVSGMARLVLEPEPEAGPQADAA
jgi:hypothetical protein